MRSARFSPMPTRMPVVKGIARAPRPRAWRGGAPASCRARRRAGRPARQARPRASRSSSPATGRPPAAVRARRARARRRSRGGAGRSRRARPRTRRRDSRRWSGIRAPRATRPRRDSGPRALAEGEQRLVTTRRRAAPGDREHLVELEVRRHEMRRRLGERAVAAAVAAQHRERDEDLGEKVTRCRARCRALGRPRPSARAAARPGALSHQPTSPWRRPGRHGPRVAARSPSQAPAVGGDRGGRDVVTGACGERLALALAFHGEDHEPGALARAGKGEGEPGDGVGGVAGGDHQAITLAERGGAREERGGVAVGAEPEVDEPDRVVPTQLVVRPAPPRRKSSRARRIERMTRGSGPVSRRHGGHALVRVGSSGGHPPFVAEPHVDPGPIERERGERLVTPAAVSPRRGRPRSPAPVDHEASEGRGHVVGPPRISPSPPRRS